MASYRTFGFEIIPGSNEGINPLQALLSTGLPMWQQKLAKKIFEETADGKLHSIFGPSGWNTDLIDKLKALYLSPEYKTLSDYDKMGYLSKQSGASFEIIHSFVNHLADADIKDTPPGNVLGGYIGIIALVATAVIVVNIAPLFKKR